MEAGEEFGWHRMPRVLPELEHSDLLFMDDGVLWSGNCTDLARKVTEFSRVLRLSLNLKKCQLYCTPACPGPHAVTVQNITLTGSECLEIMGLSLYQGVTMTSLVQPLMVRAQTKFWSLKHVFRCKVSAVERLRLMHKVVTNSALWCSAAFPPDKGALKAVNTQQMLLVGWLLRLGKRRNEEWLAFRLRLVRSARAMLHRAGLPRWSTCWLQRWWGYAGHRARSMLRDTPPFSAEIDSVRTLQWWTRQSAAGRRHPGQFCPPPHEPRASNGQGLRRPMARTCA